MLLMSCDKISKTYGDRKIFSEVSLKIYFEDRIGLVGANGAGKSTLLKILAGIETPDEGQIRTCSKISYIGQQDDGVAEISTNRSDDISEGKLTSVLGVNVNKFHRNMSGGEKSRAHFTLNFDPKAGLLLVDEPTSNMDIEASGIIEKELMDYCGALILITHDRSLLDKLCTSILEISDGKVRHFTGNYSKYIEQREEIYNRQMFEYDAYTKEKKRLESRVQERTENARSIRKAPNRMGVSEARLHRRSAAEIQEKLHKSIDAMKTRLEHLDKKDRPSELPVVKMAIEPPENPVSSVVLRAKNFSLGFPGLSLLESVAFEVPKGKRTALMGSNGTGKSSLADIIVKNETNGTLTLSPGVKIGYFKQNLNQLSLSKTVIESVISESTRPESEVRTILARLLIKRDDVYKKIHALSGGEKVKVSLAEILVSDANFLILDEPTNYLDVFSMEALERVLCDYTGTLLIISHDRKFIENVAQRLLIIENHKIKTYEGSLIQYENELRNRKTQNDPDEVLNKTIIDMRLAELAMRIDSCKEESLKMELEKQYFELCKLRK